MAERRNALTFSILSDAAKFDLADAARELEDLGRGAQDTGTDLRKLEDDAARLDLDKGVGRPARDAAGDLRDLRDDARRVDLEGTVGRDAKDTARKVDDAFDTIARASRTSATKVDASSRNIRDDLDGVKEEAGSTAREAAASFSGSGDIGDAMQELAANAPAALGPLGLAFGVVAGIGVGLFKSKTEALKTRVEELVDAMIDAGGRLTKEFIDSEVLTLVKEGEAERLEELVKRYKLVGVTTRDVIRARAGDEEAIARVDAALDKETKRRKDSAEEMGRSEAAVAALRDAYTAGEEAMRLAKEATADYQNATGAAATTTAEDAEAIEKDWNHARRNLAAGIKAPIRVDAPSAAQLAAIRSGIVRGIGPVTLQAPTLPPPRNAVFYPGRYRP